MIYEYSHTYMQRLLYVLFSINGIERVMHHALLAVLNVGLLLINNEIPVLAHVCE